MKAENSVKNARTGDEASPRLLDADRRQVDATENRNASGLVADWFANDNVDFARAQANRIWFHLMGRGLVDPVDDFRITNPASHPDLLDYLAQEFIKAKFDVRSLIRLIMHSRSYQTGSATSEPSELQLTNYAVARVSRLTAEQLLDAQCQFLNVAPEFNGHDAGIRAGQLPGVHKINPRRQTPTRDDRFLMVFGKPERLLTCECERVDDTTLSQVFMLVSDRVAQERLGDERGRIQTLLRDGCEPLDVGEQLYWWALSRPPSQEETAKLTELLRGCDADGATIVLQDLAWALMNSKEFVFRN